MATRPVPDELYVHFRGGTYEVLAPVGRDANEAEREVVVYRDVVSGQVWVRTLDDFLASRLHLSDGRTCVTFGCERVHALRFTLVSERSKDA